MTSRTRSESQILAEHRRELAAVCFVVFSESRRQLALCRGFTGTTRRTMGYELLDSSPASGDSACDCVGFRIRVKSGRRTKTLIVARSLRLLHSYDIKDKVRDSDLGMKIVESLFRFAS